MPSSNNQNTSSPLIPNDLKDPALAVLNNKFSFLYGQVSSVTASTSGKTASGSFQRYIPVITGSSTYSNLSGGGYCAVNSGRADLILEITFTITGATSSTISVSLPTFAIPDRSISRYVLNGFVTSQNNPSVLALAYIGNAGVIVNKYDSTSFALGSCELSLSGFYKV